ncbi:hypothetical protein HF925_08665 [Acidithiobacillus ferriphilus]|uniref:hypothetical protein n=1 Tax=Acidithiobacillus ferriphilus TaxID=1689834 RepID=UPI001C07557C|nr:hypothetical protein [Acidithiobacillus ferriphilus]MBU2848649.1 hypothetical protein [Acidithiobacillus ferriphilus]
MKIASLMQYSDDLTLRWLNGVSKMSDGSLRVDVLFHRSNGESIFQRLPFGMLPFLTPGFVVSGGTALTTRRGGKNARAVIPDLSRPEIDSVLEAVTRRHYDLGGHTGGEHQILRYASKDWTILIPAMELIRFLFLHGKVLANAILQPMGLTDLALTPTPGLYPDILIEFQRAMPRALTRSEFVQEFAWAAVHPDGRRAWDSVLRLSKGQRSLMLEPPSLQNCRVEFRGVAQNKTWLVLEIIAVSGRNLPAQEIVWMHPSEREPSDDSDGDESEGLFEEECAGEGRPAHVREQMIDDQAKSQEDINQAVVLLGGKRGQFNTPARVTKILSPTRPRTISTPFGEQQTEARKTRSDAGQLIDSTLPLKIITQPVSMGESAVVEGLPPIEVSMLEPLDWDAAGDLHLLVKVLRLVEQSQADVTLTTSLISLKTGFGAITRDGRRACLVAVFTSSIRPPSVLLDVDHSNLPGGLSGLVLRYHEICALADMERHIKLLLDRMIDHFGRWDETAEQTLSKHATVKRLPKLARMTEKANDMNYLKSWSKRLESLLWE